jgi:hypothetical protein
MFYKTSEEEKLRRLEEDSAQGRIPKAEYAEKQEHSQREVTKARKWRGLYHNTILWTFALAVLLSVLLLGFGTFSSESANQKKDDPCSVKADCKKQDVAKAPANRFVIVQSAVHRTAHGREAHTFLLDQEKGATWVMTCSTQGVVEFDRVKTLGLNGAPEDPSK